MKITRSQLKQVIKEELSSAMSEDKSIDKDKAVDVAKKIKDTDIGKKMSQIAMKDPKIRKILDDLASKVDTQKLEEEMGGEMTMSGIMGGGMAYMLLGMPGLAALQAAIGPVAASVGLYGGTMLAGAALGLLADYMIYKAGGSQ
jgi:hypothetical protein